MKGLKLLLAVDRNLLTKLGDANAEDIDDAMIEVAKLALSLRSDDAPPFDVLLLHEPTSTLDELDDATRRAWAARR